MNFIINYFNSMDAVTYFSFVFITGFVLFCLLMIIGYKGGKK